MVRRERELAFRAALGAEPPAPAAPAADREHAARPRSAALLGLALAHWGVAAARRVRRAVHAARRRDHASTTTVLLFTFVVVGRSPGLVFGSVPALERIAVDVAPALREGGRADARRVRGVRSALIVVQVAASFMLLIGAGLTIRSLIKLQQVDPGFSTDNILTMRIDLNFSKYNRRQPAAGSGSGSRNSCGRAGRASVGGGGTFPLNEQAPFSDPSADQGRGACRPRARPQVDFRLATPDYFDTIGQPLLAGARSPHRRRWLSTRAAPVVDRQPVAGATLLARVRIRRQADHSATMAQRLVHHRRRRRRHPPAAEGARARRALRADVPAGQLPRPGWFAPASIRRSMERQIP